MREPVLWLTNHPHLAQALGQWRGNTSGTEPDKHAQVKNGLASVRYPVELVESFLKAVREDLRAGEEHRMWQHLQAERVNQARREEVQ